MKTVGYYLDYMAQSFGVTDRTKLKAAHLSLFKKYLMNCIETWELKGDMDYLKKLGMHNTNSAVTGTLTANRGEKQVSLSNDPGFKAVGCDLFVNGKIYVLTKYVSSGTYEIFPAYLDSNTTTEAYEVRFNRFPVPPLFKKVLNKKMIYLTDLSQRHEIEERDFSLLPLDKTEGDPLFFQAKYTTRDHGFQNTVTINGQTVTRSSGQIFTDEMANMPVIFEDLNEVYYIRNVASDGESVVLDRPVSENQATAVDCFVLPAGTLLFEIFPHPNESRMIIYDYLESEAEKLGEDEFIQAPKSVIEAGLDLKMAKFKEDSTSSRQELRDLYDDIAEAAKMKNVTNYAPSIKYLGSCRDTTHSLTDYGRRGTRRRNPYGRFR